jgi:hypothetical protein
MAAGAAHDGLFLRPLRRRVRVLPVPALVLYTILATALIAFDATGDPLALFTTLALLSTFVYVFATTCPWPPSSVTRSPGAPAAARRGDIGDRCDRPRHGVLGMDGGRDGRRGRAARHGVDPDRHPGLVVTRRTNPSGRRGALC